MSRVNGVTPFVSNEVNKSNEFCLVSVQLVLVGSTGHYVGTSLQTKSQKFERVTWNSRDCVSVFAIRRRSIMLNGRVWSGKHHVERRRFFFRSRSRTEPCEISCWDTPMKWSGSRRWSLSFGIFPYRSSAPSQRQSCSIGQHLKYLRNTTTKVIRASQSPHQPPPSTLLSLTNDSLSLLFLCKLARCREGENQKETAFETGNEMGRRYRSKVAIICTTESKFQGFRFFSPSPTLPLFFLSSLSPSSFLLFFF